MGCILIKSSKLLEEQINSIKLVFFNVTDSSGYCFIWHKEIINRGGNKISISVLNIYLFIYLSDSLIILPTAST